MIRSLLGKQGDDVIISARMEREGRYEVRMEGNQFLLAKTHDFDHALYIQYCNQNSLLTDTCG